MRLSTVKARVRPPATRSPKIRKKPIQLMKERAVLVTGRVFHLPNNKTRKTVDINIIERWDGYKKAQSVKKIRRGQLVGIYDGKIVLNLKRKTGDKQKFRQQHAWTISIPGYRGIKSLSAANQYDGMMQNGNVGAYFDSSRGDPKKSNPRDANCTAQWMLKSYDDRTIDGRFVKVCLIANENIAAGVDLTCNYRWL